MPILLISKHIFLDKYVSLRLYSHIFALTFTHFYVYIYSVLRLHSYSFELAFAHFVFAFVHFFICICTIITHTKFHAYTLIIYQYLEFEKMQFYAIFDNLKSATYIDTAYIYVIYIRFRINSVCEVARMRLRYRCPNSF